MFEKSFERVLGKHAERIFIMKISVMCVIFGITVVAIVMNAQNTLTENYPLSNGSDGFQFITPNTVGASGFKDYVPILEKGFENDLPVEQGQIIIRDSKLPTELPIKMTDEVVAEWYIIVAVKGGYEPLDGFGAFYNNKDPQEFIGRIMIIATLVERLDCCWVIYRITFDVVEDWCFESSYYPEVAEEEGIIPGKLIDLCWWTIWQGCDDLDQRFTVLLVT